jgi:(p)ppGpp synthase/HD superfamily hydrolase
MVAAAWLHDVVDDQEVHLGQIREAFGDQVAGLVGELTDPASLEEGDRHRHAEINRLHAAMASREAQTVKLADLVDSVRAMLEYHPNGSTTYMDEARELLLARATRACGSWPGDRSPPSSPATTGACSPGPDPQRGKLFTTWSPPNLAS